MTSTDTLFALAVLRNISSPNEHLVTLFGRSLQEGLQTKDPRTGGTSANFENETGAEYNWLLFCKVLKPWGWKGIGYGVRGRVCCGKEVESVRMRGPTQPNPPQLDKGSFLQNGETVFTFSSLTQMLRGHTPFQMFRF